MANLVNRDNFYRDLFDFRRDFENIFNRFFSDAPTRSGVGRETSSQSLIPAVNAYLDKDKKTFHCQVALPGVDPKQINLQVHGDVLSISGQRENREEKTNADVVYREWAFESFERDIPLPEGVDRDKVSAEYRNGILEITAPIAAAAMPRRVEVKGAAEPKQMSAGSGR
jgi:HSP20 family protein